MRLLASVATQSNWLFDRWNVLTARIKTLTLGMSTYLGDTLTNQRAVHVVVFDGYADWEPGHALAELRRSGKRTVRTVGFSTESVVSMGGLRVLPDIALSDVRPDDVELLILPGGDMWQSESYPRVALESLVTALVERDTPVAGICAGTVALARARVLDDRRHTSNMQVYLPQYAPEYAGQANYIERPAVRDRHVITASGLSPVDFARDIFAELSVFAPEHETLWFDMFKHGRLPSASDSRQPPRVDGPR